MFERHEYQYVIEEMTTITFNANLKKILILVLNN